MRWLLVESLQPRVLSHNRLVALERVADVAAAVHARTTRRGRVGARLHLQVA